MAVGEKMMMLWIKSLEKSLTNTNMKNINKLYFTATFAALLLTLASCNSHQPDDSYQINGTLKGIDSGLVKLVKYNDGDRTSKTLDSVKFSHGIFELKGKVDQPEMMSLIIEPGNWVTQVFVEQGKITIQADTTEAEHYDYTSYGGDKGASLKKVEVTGSANQEAFSKYENAPELLKFKTTFAALNKAYEAEKNAELKEKMRSKFDSVGKLSKAWELQWINDFVNKNPGSVAGAYIFSNHYRGNSELPLTELDAILAKFNGAAKTSAYYKNLVKEADSRKALLPGKIAPDFTLLKRDSTTFTLSSTRGKYIMLDFWASWCKPCREAIPHWKTVYAKYNDKGFEIISVSDDSKWTDWTTAMDQEKMPWTQVIDEFPVKNMPARVGTLYQTHFIPFYVLLDKDGKILVYSGEEKDIDQKLAEIFK
jgi:thiol-disulfide isomerase/thioredoxin